MALKDLHRQPCRKARQGALILPASHPRGHLTSRCPLSSAKFRELPSLPVKDMMFNSPRGGLEAAQLPGFEDFAAT